MRTEAHWTGMHASVYPEFQPIHPRGSWLVKARRVCMSSPSMVLAPSHPLGVALQTLIVT